jgi:hypothetical protein
VTAYCLSLSMLDKVLQPGKTKLVGSPAVRTDTNPPIWWVVVIPGLVVVLCFEDEERWDRLPYSIDASD